MFSYENLLNVLYGLAGTIGLRLTYLIFRKKKENVQPEVSSNPLSGYEGPSAIGYNYQIQSSPSNMSSIRKASTKRPSNIPFEQMTLADTMPELFNDTIPVSGR